MCPSCLRGSMRPSGRVSSSRIFTVPLVLSRAPVLPGLPAQNLRSTADTHARAGESSCRQRATPREMRSRSEYRRLWACLQDVPDQPRSTSWQSALIPPHDPFYRAIVAVALLVAPASLPLQLYLLVPRREDVAGDESDPRFLHPRSQAVHAGVQPDRRDHHLVVDELLDAVQGRLAPLRVQLVRLFLEEPIDVGIAPVGVRAAADQKGLDPGGRVTESAAAALDEAAGLLFGPPPEIGCPLEGPELDPNAGGVEVVDHGLAEVRHRRVAEVIARVEAVGIAGLGEELLRPGGVIRVPGRLPVELEAGGNNAPDELGESQDLGLVYRLPVDCVVRGQAHAPVVPRRLGVPLLGEVDPVRDLSQDRCY